VSLGAGCAQSVENARTWRLFDVGHNCLGRDDSSLLAPQLVELRLKLFG
jgi:hypothetical protein